MKVLSKILTGAILATTVLIVACGKKNGGGGTSGIGNAGCVSVGAACVAPGTPGFGGTFEGTIGGPGGGYMVTIRLRNNGGGYGGGWGGGWGGGGYQAQPAQAIISMSIRSLQNQISYGQPIPGRSATGSGLFAVGGLSQITASDRFVYQIASQFSGNQMNIQITGAIQAAGVIYQVGGRGQGQYFGGGYQGASWDGGAVGFGGGFDGGGFVEEVIPSPAAAGYRQDGYWGW